jgi:hypothetical protein
MGNNPLLRNFAGLASVSICTLILAASSVVPSMGGKMLQPPKCRANIRQVRIRPASTRRGVRRRLGHYARAS